MHDVTFAKETRINTHTHTHLLRARTHKTYGKHGGIYLWKKNQWRGHVCSRRLKQNHAPPFPTTPHPPAIFSTKFFPTTFFPTDVPTIFLPIPPDPFPDPVQSRPTKKSCTTPNNPVPSTKWLPTYPSHHPTVRKREPFPIPSPGKTQRNKRLRRARQAGTALAPRK